MRLLGAVVAFVVTAVFWGTVWLVGGLTVLGWVVAASVAGTAVVVVVELRRGVT